MQLVVHSLSIDGHRNIRTWEPADPLKVAEGVTLEIGPRGKKNVDIFWIEVATPRGLEELEAKDGIIAHRPLVVLERYDYHLLWDWVMKTVSSCEAQSWNDCLSRLRRFFGWEYDGQ